MTAPQTEAPHPLARARWKSHDVLGKPPVLQAFGIALLGIAVFLVVVMLFLVHREHQIRFDAVGLNADLRAAEQSITGNGANLEGSARLAAARASLLTLQQHSNALHDQTSGFAWSVGSYVPGLRRPLLAVRQLADVSADVANQVLPRDIQTLGDLAQQHIGTGLNLKPLQDRASGFASDVTLLDASITKVNAIRRTGVGSLDNARNQVLDGLHQLDGYTRTLAVAAHVAPELLGADGPRTDLVILQSPAEERGGGGFVGGYIELTAANGKVSATASGGNTDLFARNPTSPVLQTDPQYAQLYGSRYATVDWRDSNLSPDFTETGPIWAAMYQKGFGPKISGVIGVTPETLGRILYATGPVPIEGVGVLTAQNAADFLERDIYSRFPGEDQDAQRNQLQVTVLRAVITQLLAYRGDPIPLLSVLGSGADAGDVRLYTSDPAAEAWLATTPVAGALPSTPGPFYGAVVNSADTTKLGVYLNRTVIYKRTAIAKDPAHQKVTLTVKLTNSAPATGLPAYVTTRGELGAAARAANVPGTHQVLLSLYLATDASFSTLTVNGTAQKPALSGRERNHLFVEAVPPALAPGASTTVVLTGVEPTSTAAPGTIAQAGSH